MTNISWFDVGVSPSKKTSNCAIRVDESPFVCRTDLFPATRIQPGSPIAELRQNLQQRQDRPPATHKCCQWPPRNHNRVTRSAWRHIFAGFRGGKKSRKDEEPALRKQMPLRIRSPTTHSNNTHSSSRGVTRFLMPGKGRSSAASCRSSMTGTPRGSCAASTISDPAYCSKMPTSRTSARLPDARRVSAAIPCTHICSTT